MAKYLNLNLDEELGGKNASDYEISSQKAVKTYVDKNVKIDNETIARNENGELQSVGTIDQNTGSAIFDWIGTEEEWNEGRKNGTIPDDWICYITDDIAGDSGETYVAGEGIKIENGVISSEAIVIVDYTGDL